MFPINLNRKYGYTLINKTYIPNAAELLLINDAAITKSYWTRKKYEEYRKELKSKHYFGQTRRCAYCRKTLRTDAYWEDLDHVVAQSIKEKWIFHPKNLIVTCEPCNRLKNADATLTDPSITDFPTSSTDFTIFNPHFDNWSDNFEIFKGIFLRGKPGTKGPNTYKYCHLYRHDVIINNVDEKRIWNVFTMRRLTHKLKEVEIDSVEFTHIKKAIIHMIARKKNKE